MQLVIRRQQPLILQPHGVIHEIFPGRHSLNSVILQIQMRDISGFVDTRYRLLQLRSNNRNNWIAFAIAHHLDGNHELCVQILSAYESTLVSNTYSSSGSGSCHEPDHQLRRCNVVLGIYSFCIHQMCHSQQSILRETISTSQLCPLLLSFMLPSGSYQNPLHLVLLLLR